MRMNGSTVAAFVAAAFLGCGGVDNESSVEATEELGQTESALTAATCRPTYNMSGPGLNMMGTTGKIVYVAASGNILTVQGRNSSGTLVSGNILTTGFTISGNWGTSNGYGKITSISISAGNLVITGVSGTTSANTVAMTKTLTFNAPVDIGGSGFTGGTAGNINAIYPFLTTTTGLKFGLTGSGYTATNTNSLLCP